VIWEKIHISFGKNPISIKEERGANPLFCLSGEGNFYESREVSFSRGKRLCMLFRDCGKGRSHGHKRRGEYGILPGGERIKGGRKRRFSRVKGGYRAQDDRTSLWGGGAEWIGSFPSGRITYIEKPLKKKTHWGEWRLRVNVKRGGGGFLSRPASFQKILRGEGGSTVRS